VSPSVLPTTALVPTGPDDGRLDAIRRMPEASARRAAAAEIQSVFLAQLLRAMRKTVPESDFLPKSPERSVYEGVFDESVAGALATQDPLGLVKTLGGPAAAPSSSIPGVPITAVDRKDGSKR
jgi:flagellar protein FlgJ